MAKTNDVANDQVQGTTAAVEEKKSPKVTTDGPAQKTLGQLVGETMQIILDDGNGKRMPEFKNKLTIWHHAQSLENRKEQVLENKRKLELARQVLESVFAHYREISMMDANG